MSSVKPHGIGFFIENDMPTYMSTVMTLDMHKSMSDVMSQFLFTDMSFDMPLGTVRFTGSFKKIV
jgi:hypothetical protein